MRSFASTARGREQMPPRAASLFRTWVPRTVPFSRSTRKSICVTETTSALASSCFVLTSTGSRTAHEHGDTRVTQPEMPSSAPIASGSNGTSTVRGEIRVKLFARTDVGQIREHNEDNFLVADLTRKSRGLADPGTTGPNNSRVATIGRHGSVFAVCDGMGGAAAGEIASQLAVDIVFERLVDGL